MYTKSDIQRRRQIFNGFIQKSVEEKPAEEGEKSPAEVEREKEQNKD